MVMQAPAIFSQVKGQVRATCFLKTGRRRRNASSGMVTKRMKRNGPTPSVSSRYLTNAKFTPHRNMVNSAATSDQRRGGTLKGAPKKGARKVFFLLRPPEKTNPKI